MKTMTHRGKIYKFTMLFSSFTTFIFFFSNSDLNATPSVEATLVQILTLGTKIEQPTIEVSKCQIQSGTSFTVAVDKLESHTQNHDLPNGFYKTPRKSNDLQEVVLVLFRKNDLFEIYRPYSPNCNFVDAKHIRTKYQKITINEAEDKWNIVYNLSKTKCSHLIWRNECNDKDCEYGLRVKTRFFWPAESKLIDDNFSQVISLDGVKKIGYLASPYEHEVIVKRNGLRILETVI